VIPADLHNYIVAKYVEKRKFQREGNAEASYMYVTPRTLLAIIRLSQAMAKLNFRDQVRQSDVDEALRLMDYSIRSLRKIKGNTADKRNANKEDAKKDKMTTVMNLVRTIMQDKPPMTVNALLTKIHSKE
jgi:DNA replicative helicase MCM subunit Mcm2 (Cdc46/Mcm family)